MATMLSIRPLVVSGPSGSGKSSLLQRLLKQYPDRFGFGVSHTTRKPRPGEQHGVHYYFTNHETMERAIDDGEFIETTSYGDNLYGTSKNAVQKVLDRGKICILDIDIKGAKQIKGTDLNPLLVFVQPPSFEELERRLKARNTETEESLERRLQTAQIEMQYGLIPNNFHYIIVNDDFDRAYTEFVNYVFDALKIPKEHSK